MSISLHKVLSKNDTGETGGHQDGFHIPKTKEALSFFPNLDSSIKNPRSKILFYDKETNEHWTFTFIYYNNKFFGGTRNEYRLTRVARYIKSKGLSFGDTIMLDYDKLNFVIAYKLSSSLEDKNSPIHLSGKKRVIYI